MARITIYIPDSLQAEMTGRVTMNVSKVCQVAIRAEIDRIIADEGYRFECTAQGETGTWINTCATREEADEWVSARKSEKIWRNVFHVKVVK